MMYFIKTSASNLQLAEEKLMNYFYDINYALVMWGSADAILEWHEFQTVVKTPTPEMTEQQKLLWTFAVRDKLAELVKVIRSDLGHADRNLPLAIIADLYIPIRDKDEVLRRLLADQPVSSVPPSTAI
jgi:hypothetical protein